MSYSCCSGNTSSRYFGSYLPYSGSCGSAYNRNLVSSTNLCPSSTCQRGSSFYRGCQDTFLRPSRYQTSCAVSRPCQPSCYRPRTSTFCSPCPTTYAGSLGSVSSSGCSQGYGSRSCGSSSFGQLGYRVGAFPSQGYGSRSCGSSGFEHLGYRLGGFSSQGYGSGLCRPSRVSSRPCQSSCYQPTCGSGSGFC